jgi:TPR repeat protein
VSAARTTASDEHETVLERLLSLLAEDGRHDEIGAVVREAARSPDRRVRARAAELLGKRGDWSGAAASWQADADRGDPAAQLALANALVQLDRTDEAETWLRRASTSGDLTAASRLGALLHAEGRTVGAVLLCVWGGDPSPPQPPHRFGKHLPVCTKLRRFPRQQTPAVAASSARPRSDVATVSLLKDSSNQRFQGDIGLVHVPIHLNHNTDPTADARIKLDPPQTLA